MGKQWYFQVMGTEFGPITSAQLKEKAIKGQIDAETLVRLGTDGKWQPAVRVKGLLDPMAESPEESIPPEPVAKHPAKVAASKSMPAAPTTTTVEIPLSSPPPATPLNDRVYHFVGETHADSLPVEEQETSEYEFFDFVAFDQAIGHALHELLMEYCRTKGQTMTQVTRRALAEYLGRKDLAGEMPPAQAAGNPSPPVNGVEANTSEIKT